MLCCVVMWLCGFVALWLCALWLRRCVCLCVPVCVLGTHHVHHGAGTSVRITKFNIATFRGFGPGEKPEDVTMRGPVEFGEAGDEITAGFTLFGRGDLVTLIVDQWPYQRCVHCYDV